MEHKQERPHRSKKQKREVKGVFGAGQLVNASTLARWQAELDDPNHPRRKPPTNKITQVKGR